MDRPNIPEPVKREVRKRCFFGCIICGSPVFHYDHVIEWSEVREHSPDNLVLLCERHHGAKTTGKLSVETVLDAQKNPFNKTRTATSSYKIEPSKAIDIALGSNTFLCDFPTGEGNHLLLFANSRPLFILHAEDSWLSVSFICVDPNDLQPVIGVDRGELIVNVGVWDYSYVGTRLQIRRGQGDIVLDLELSDRRVAIDRGAFLTPTGDGFFVKDGSLATFANGVPRNTFMGSMFGQNAVGAIGLNNSANNPDKTRYGGFGYFEMF